MPMKERDREIRRRRQRREKMEYLRKRMLETKDAKTCSAILQKIIKINPLADVPQK